MAINSSPPSVADLERTIAQYVQYILLLERRVDVLERLTWKHPLPKTLTDYITRND